MNYCLRVSKRTDLADDADRARAVKVQLDYIYGNFHAVIVGQNFSDEIEAEDRTLLDISIGETRYLCWYPRNEKRDHWLRTV